MKSLYNINSLVTYDEWEIKTRQYLIDMVSMRVKQILRKQNKAWQFFQIESPSLIPRSFISQNYTSEDMFMVDEQLCLKPETTPASFCAAKEILRQQEALPPLCVWQHSKSYRREQDQSMVHMRLKEFYHLEYQCIYTKSTKNNYQESCIEEIAQMFLDILHLPTRIVVSDRLPAYSMKTLDIEVQNNHKWMEVCSVSLRKDFVCEHPINNQYPEYWVLEIATSTDRLLHNLREVNTFHKLKVENLL